LQDLDQEYNGLRRGMLTQDFSTYKLGTGKEKIYPQIGC
jgi:hypothetical protein